MLKRTSLATARASSSSASSPYVSRAASSAPNSSNPFLRAALCAGGAGGRDLSSRASMTGRDVVVREWNDGPHFCRLCNEPMGGGFNEHRGKREHVALETLFEAIVEYARDWNPSDVMRAYDRRSSTTPAKLRERLLATKRRSPDYFCHPEFAPFGSLLNFFDETERMRRQNVYAIAKHLVERGALYFGPQQCKHPLLSESSMALSGMLVTFFWVHPRLRDRVPNAVAAQVSCMSQQCSASYSLGTIFDLFGFGDLLDPRELASYNSNHPLGQHHHQQQQRRLQSVSAPATHAPSSHNQQQQQQQQQQQSSSCSVHDFLDIAKAELRGSTDTELDQIYWVKATLLRNVLGQLRWAMDDDDTPIHNSPIASQVLQEPHLAVLAQELAQGIVAEAVFVRFAEYVTRAETAWRKLGCPTSSVAFRDETCFAVSSKREQAEEDPGVRSAQAVAMAMMQGSFDDGLAAVLGPRKGAVVDFESGGRATAAGAEMRFASGRDAQRIAVAELEHLRRAQSEATTTTSKKRRRAFSRVPGTALSLTAERLLRESQGGLASGDFV